MTKSGWHGEAILGEDPDVMSEDEHKMDRVGTGPAVKVEP